MADRNEYFPTDPVRAPGGAGAAGFIRVNILYTFDLTNGAFRARRGG